MGLQLTLPGCWCLAERCHLDQSALERSRWNRLMAVQLLRAQTFRSAVVAASLAGCSRVLILCDLHRRWRQCSYLAIRIDINQRTATEMTEPNGRD